MQKVLFLFIIQVLITLPVFAQDNEVRSDFYIKHNITAIDIVDVYDEIKFEPQFALYGYHDRSIKTVILQFNPAEIRQINIDGWSFCS